MNARPIALAALALTLLVAALTFVLLRPAHEPSDAAPMPALARDALDAEFAVAPVASVGDEVRIDAAEPAPPELDGDAGQLPRAQVFLVGAVHSATTPMHQVKLFAMPGGERRDRSAGLGRSVSAVPQPEGAFRIDVSRAFLVDAPFPESLLLQATRSAGSSTEVVVPVTFEPAALEREGVLELSAQLTLPDVCRVAGSAWIIDDLEAGVQVAAFELVAGVPGSDAYAVDTARSPGHEFELTLECGREYLVVAYSPGYRPRSHHVTAGESFSADALALQAGPSIRGRTAFAERPFACTLSARPVGLAAGAKTHSAGDARFVWDGEEFEWARIFVQVGPFGEFVVEGLAEREYELSVTASAGANVRGLPPTIVRAPATELVLAPPIAELRVAVYAADHPSANAALRLVAIGRDGQRQPIDCRTAADGVAVLWLAPETRVEFTAADGVREFRCGPAGSSTPVRIDS